jgi:tRNA pseudouridine55 synthase
MPDGILLVDKPKGWTSHDVVAKVRGILKKEAGKKIKVGHTGTLDPLATGLMVLVIGSYCKRASEFSKLDKTYGVTMKLGETSATGDEEGAKTKVSDKEPAEDEIKSVLVSFVGEIQQTPPAYSAIKIDGRRAYKLAREGEAVKLEPRPVTIYEITDIKYDYPLVSFIAKVSSGTYIRSLTEDIGEKLGTGAYLTGLRRTMVGGFSIEQAISPTEVNLDKIIQI